MFQCSSCSGLQSARPLAEAPPVGREAAAAAGGALNGRGWVAWAERDGCREAERDGSGGRRCGGGGGGGDSCCGGSGSACRATSGSGKGPKPSGSQCSSATCRVPPPSPLRPCSTTVSAATQLRATTASKRACVFSQARLECRQRNALRRQYENILPTPGADVVGGIRRRPAC